MFADEIRRAIEASSRIALSSVTALLWRAYGEGKVTEAEAEALSGLIEARQTVAHSEPQLPVIATNLGGIIHLPDRLQAPGRAAGSRPRSDASMERRRRWAASGRLPPGLAARFTLAEQAALSLIAAETARRGDCRLAIGHLASIVGVAETTVRNAIREARKLGFLTVEERRLTGFRNNTNVVRIISPEWTAWLRLARKGVLRFQETPSLAKGGGCKSAKGTPTQVLIQRENEDGTPLPKVGCTPESAITKNIVDGRRARPSLCWGGLRAGATLEDGKRGCRGAAELLRVAYQRY